MESKEMEQLLERYWKGETSLEEEVLLRSHFAHGESFEGNLSDRLWFSFLEEERAVRLDEDFDHRVCEAIETPVVKAHRMSLLARCMPLFKAAAAVAVFVSFGQWLQHPFGGQPETVSAVDTIGKHMSAPSVALSGEKAVSREKQLLDSLQRASHEEAKR